MQIAYKITNYVTDYETKGYFNSLSEFIDYLMSLGKDSLGIFNNEWVWDNNLISCRDDEATVLNSFEEAMDFAVNYVQNKEEFCRIYNRYEHNVYYEFINLEREEGIELYYELFNGDILMTYCPEINKDGSHNAILMFNPCTAIKHCAEYKKDGYTKIKKIGFKGGVNIFDIARNGKNFYIVSNNNKDNGDAEYEFVNSKDKINLNENTIVYTIDKAILD